MGYIKEIAIIGLVILEGIALYKGIDGTVLTLVAGAICGLAGYEIGKTKKPET